MHYQQKDEEYLLKMFILIRDLNTLMHFILIFGGQQLDIVLV